MNSPESSQANLSVARARLPGTFEGAQCKEKGSQGVGTGAGPSPSLPTLAARCGRHSIPSRTAFPPAPSPGAISRTAGEAEPRVGGEPSPSPPQHRLGGALPPARAREGLGCPEPPPAGHRPSSGSRIRCTARMSSWARRRCASAPRMEQAARSAETPPAFPKSGSPGDRGEPRGLHRTDLVVRAVLLLALATLEEVGHGAARLGHLVLPDGLLGHGVPQLLQLIAGHLLSPAPARQRQRCCRSARGLAAKPAQGTSRLGPAPSPSSPGPGLILLSVLAGGLRPIQMKKITPSSNLNCCVQGPGSPRRELGSQEPDVGTPVEEEEWGPSNLTPASVTSHTQLCDGLQGSGGTRQCPLLSPCS